MKFLSSEKVWKEIRVADAACAAPGGPTTLSLELVLPALASLVGVVDTVDLPLVVGGLAAVWLAGPPYGTERIAAPPRSRARMTVTIATFSPAVLELMARERRACYDEDLSECSDKSIYHETMALHAQPTVDSVASPSADFAASKLISCGVDGAAKHGKDVARRRRQFGA